MRAQVLPPRLRPVYGALVGGVTAAALLAAIVALALTMAAWSRRASEESAARRLDVVERDLAAVMETERAIRGTVVPMRNTTDIERARKAKLRDVRRAARDRWLDRLSVSVEVTWPRGVLGWICGALLMLTPPALVVLAVWIWTRRKDRNSTDGGTGSAA